MREIKYLSPTSLMLYQRSPELWYLRYCCETQLPRTPQGRPASVGSAFDALIKSRLYRHYYFEVPTDHPYSAKTLLAAQVEAQNYEWAVGAGIHCLHQYERCGAAADLLLASREPPEFEFKLRQTITFDGLDVPIYGIPDMSYQVDGVRVILDWKVMGFCSKSVTSPAPGYLTARDGWDLNYRQPSRTHRTRHKDVTTRQVAGLTVSSRPLEEANAEWATQLTTYAWLLGCQDHFIAAVEQLCGYPDKVSEFPDLRIASFRNTVSSGFQDTLMGQYTQLWLAYKSGHIFLTEPRAASDDHCRFLDNLANTLMKSHPDSPEFQAAVAFISGKDVYDVKRDYRRDIIEARRLRGETGLPDPDDYSGIVAQIQQTQGLIQLPQSN